MQPMPDESELELRDYLRVLNRRKWIVAVVVLLVVGASVGASLLQTPVYNATAEVLLQPRTTESLFDQAAGQTLAVERNVQTEVRVIKSDPVKSLVRTDLGGAPPVSVSNPTDTEFVLITAENTSPSRAATVANSYAKSYVEYRRRQAVEELEQAAKELETKISELDDDINNAQQAAAAPANGRSPTTTVQNQFAEGSLDTMLRNRDLFVNRLDQLRLATTQKTGGAQFVTPAFAATSPIRPTPLRNAIVALVVGLILGVGIAFLRDYFDDSLRSTEDVEQAVHGLPVIGMIPALSGWKDRGVPLVVSLSDPKSPATEAYRALRTSVQFLGVERPLRLVQITSPSAAEGKSTTIANLAVALANAGQRVTVVDADLRRPRIHHFFGLRNDTGLTSVLLGETPLSMALQPVDGVVGLQLLASGPIPPNPSELLSGEHCADVLRALLGSADYVLIDCPPVLPVTDATVLSSRVDGTLLVATANETSQKALRHARETLARVNAPLLGVVFNGVTESAGYGYAYSYRYYGSSSTTTTDSDVRQVGVRR